MTDLGSLLLPIIVSAVAVFIASSIIHMGPFWHKRDYPRLPDEDRFRAVVGPLGIPQGEYMVPRCYSNSEMKSAEFQAKVTEGPNMIVTVLPKGPFRMGGTLARWFVYTLLVSLLAGYIAGAALPPGSGYIPVFRFAGATAFIGYAVALWQMSIWWGRSWGMTAKTTLDGLIYALVTAGIFGAMWPTLS
jgi:hypothetical protein